MKELTKTKIVTLWIIHEKIRQLCTNTYVHVHILSQSFSFSNWQPDES